LVDELKIGSIDLPKEFLVGVVIAKLPSSWFDYKKKLKHDEKKYNLEGLQRHLPIEEESRNRDKK
ncbi:hypothetical protein PJP10_31550, partial [Mycobacterium kansasii]